MNAAAAIFRREFLAYFFTPLAYVITAAFILAAGAGFYQVVLIFGQPNAVPRPNPLSEVFFPIILYILMLVIPSITMRLLSEDLRSRSIELLLTAPVREGEVVVGKFLGAFAFFGVMLGVTLVFVALAAHYATPGRARGHGSRRPAARFQPGSRARPRDAISSRRSATSAAPERQPREGESSHGQHDRRDP